MNNGTLLYTQKQIDARVKGMADEINAVYAGQEVLAVCVLKGAFMFFADLTRLLNMPLELDFIELKSYGADTISSGEVTLIRDLSVDVQNKHILIVEDIADTGITLKYLTRVLYARGAKSIKTAAFLDKPSRRKTDLKTDFTGFTIPDKYVVGYGLDLAEKYRNLKAIYCL